MKSKEELLSHFVGAEGTENRAYAEQVMKLYPNYTPVGLVLFYMHTHGEICDPDEIVYKEADVVRLLDFLGYEVKFGL